MVNPKFNPPKIYAKIFALQFGYEGSVIAKVHFIDPSDYIFYYQSLCKVYSLK